ncbi:MAG TPA: hypothetical protein VHH11_20225 [Gammaproteobacteria bacterium]|nr:hypothetical protein [Gammaproteobacteria bacterium]
MNVLTWLVAGGLTGWAATAYLGATQRYVLVFNTAIALAGAALGGWILGPSLGVASGFTSFGVMVAAMGSVLALLVAYIVQRTVAR